LSPLTPTLSPKGERENSLPPLTPTLSPKGEREDSCDTSPVRPFSRWGHFRVAGGALALAWVIILGAFAYGATSVQPDYKSIGAAVFALGIAAACFLYAWREPAR